MKLKYVTDGRSSLIRLSSTRWAWYLIWSRPKKIIRIACPLGLLTLRWHKFDRR